MLTFMAPVNPIYSNIALFKLDPSGHRSIWAKTPELEQDINAWEMDFCFHFKQTLATSSRKLRLLPEKGPKAAIVV